MPITLLLSADLYNGAPVADITLDGVPLPSVPVTVPHGQPSQRVVLVAAPGPHTLVIGFANDAWGGSADTDRNLYLDGIEGVTEAVAPHAFTNNSSVTLTLTVPDDGLAMLTRLDAVLTEAAVLSQKMRGLMAHRSDVPMPVLTTTSGVYRPGAAIVLTTTAAASPVAALPAITVSPSAPTFAVGASGVFAVLSVVPSGAARTISGDGRVVLGAAGGTLVVGMTAATAGTSVPVTITDAMAGTASVTLVLSIPVTAAGTSSLNVSLRLTNARPTANVTAPLTTIGHAFARGDVPAGSRVKIMSGATTVAVQQDQEAFWSDGSLKFAALAMKPTEAFGPWTGGTVGGDTQAYAVSSEAVAPVRAPLFTLAQFVTANDIRVEFDSYDCGTDLFVASFNDIVRDFCAAPYEGGPLALTAAASAGTTSLQVASASHITKGQLVSGSGTAANTLVTAISGNTVTIAPALVAAVGSGSFLTFNSPLGGWLAVRNGQVCMEWEVWTYLKVRGGTRDGQYHTENRATLYVRSWGLQGPHEVYAEIENPNIYGHIPAGTVGPADASTRKRFVCNARVMNGTKTLAYFGGANDPAKFVLPIGSVNITTGTITWPTGTRANGYGVALSSTGTLPGDMQANTPYWIMGGDLITSRLGIGFGYPDWTPNTYFDVYGPHQVRANGGIYSFPGGGTTAATGSGPSGAAPAMDGTIQWTRVSAGTLNTQGSGTITVVPTLVCFAGGSSALLADRSAEPIWDAGTSGIAARPHMLPSYQQDYLTTKTKVVPPFDVVGATGVVSYPRTSGQLWDRGITGIFEDYYPGQGQSFGWKISQYGDDPGDERVGLIQSSSALLIFQQADRWNDMVVRSLALGFSDYKHNLRNERSGMPLVLNAGPSKVAGGPQYLGLGPVDFSSTWDNSGGFPYLPQNGSRDWSGHENTYGPLIDDSHMPNLYPIAYLRTGHRIYLNGMTKLACTLMGTLAPTQRNPLVGSQQFYGLPTIYNNTLRGTAWRTKTVAAVNFMMPSNDMMKPYFKDMLDDAAAYMAAYFPAHVHPKLTALGGFGNNLDGPTQNCYQYNFINIVLGLEAWRDADELLRPQWRDFLANYSSRNLINLYDVDQGGGFYYGTDGGLHAYSGNVNFAANASLDPNLAFQTPAALWADPSNGGLSVPQPAGFANPGYQQANGYPFDCIRYHTNWAAALAMWSWIGIPKAKVMWQRWHDAVNTAPYTGILWAQNGTNGHYDGYTAQSYVPWAIAPMP